MDHINIDFDDYKIILSHKGRVSFVNDSCKISKFVNSLAETIKNDLIKAKGVLIKFGIHKEQDFLVINDLIAKLNDFIIEDADVIFSTYESMNKDVETIEYQIIISGIIK